jgi:transcriptional regulator with XRE-family HTH domain
MTIDEIQKRLPQNGSPAAVELGERMRHVRQSRQVSARELGRALSIHVGSIYHWERGVYAPGAINLQKASIILGMPVEFFLGVELSSPSTESPQTEEIAQLIRQIGQQFSEPDPANWTDWSAEAMAFLSRVLQFGLTPHPEGLRDLLVHHPLTAGSDSPAMVRWTRRTGLVEWLLSASDAGLDIVEDVIRRLGAK